MLLDKSQQPRLLVLAIGDLRAISLTDSTNAVTNFKEEQ
jgi:hypothetical protein